MARRPLWINILVGLILMVGLLWLLYLLLGPITRHGKNKIVPAVVGKTFEEAIVILDQAGFDIEVQDSIFIDTARRGIVLRQIPEGDAIVKISRTVYLTVNRLVPPDVEMPNLIGYSFRNASMQLENMGLKVGDTTFKPDFAKNSVLEQIYQGANVAPGTKIKQGSVIDLVLGDGVGNIEFPVPGLIGLTFCEAQAKLAGTGLSLGAIVAIGISDTCNAYIIDQNPKRFDLDGKRLRIRPGQMMDVWLGLEKPASDSLFNEFPQ